jgi:hypothetical protein
MKLNVEKKIAARIESAFEDVIPRPGSKARQDILDGVRALVALCGHGRYILDCQRTELRLRNIFSTLSLSKCSTTVLRSATKWSL